ncbi:MAG TPA: energy transducer TonB [Terracidiphilus sp.]|jgi:protein TonB
MFEDSTFESTGRIKTGSRRWMLAAFTFNGSILVTLVLLPLVYPGALPQHMLPALLVAPEAPQPRTPPDPVHVRAAAPHDFPEFDQGRIIAPGRIPRTPLAAIPPDMPSFADNLGGENGPGVRGGTGTNPFNSHAVTVVHPPSPSTVRLPSQFVAGFLIYKSVPQYPIIPKTAGIQGTVVLQATISKTGTIADLRVLSGPKMLQQAAIDAVKTWRYRPYLLNEQPVEVETTVNVIFKLGS